MEVDKYGEISNTFIRLIGYLNLILKFETYQNDYNSYSEILNTIEKWAVEYEKRRNLNFVDNEILKSIYEKSDNLQTKYICNNDMGSESEFSDYVVNLIWNLRVYYKNYMEGSEKNV